ncbi:MAG: cyclic nucleotide-binding domain-containing protein, partial [Betaproteobacteria bacterium]|nr:cyclic nucleotide-binding domain-containing protein [Betaproteobacteria bacterium]
MYELLAGRLPFQATNSVAMINKILNEEPTPLHTIRPDVPPKLVEIVETAMHKDPAKRYPGWYAMARDLAETFPQLEKYSFEISSMEKFNALRKLAFFHGFRDAELWEVIRGSLWELHAREQSLLQESDVGHAFFVVIAGQAKVVKDGKLLKVLTEGDCFGEMAYLSGHPGRRSTAITAVSEVQLLKMQDVQLEQLSDACQLSFNRQFLKNLIKRLT